MPNLCIGRHQHLSRKNRKLDLQIYPSHLVCGFGLAVSLRLKLILSFVTTSLVVVTVFAVIAYNSARDYSFQVELEHVNENNLRIINMLGVNQSKLEQIEQMIPHHMANNLFYFIVDSSSGKIISKVLPENQKNIARNLLKDVTISDSNQGLFSNEDERYFWAATAIPGTQYILFNILDHKKKDVTEFLNYIGNSLAISVFLAMWFSLWAATIIANLFQRIADQKSEIEHQSRHDPLTALPNRQSIDNILQESMQRNNDDKENLLLCLVDINGLKDINDSLGHEYGDVVLRKVSEQLNELLRSSDMVARFGGDKFATILTHSKNAAIEELCSRILSTFDHAFQVDDHDLYLGATLGIASYPDHAETSQTLIQKAEIALHKAKDGGKEFFIYDPRHDPGNIERLNLANDLRHAIRERQLTMYYQPQLDLRSGKIVSVEALARWNHPTHGLIPPDTFIAIAERTGLIKPFTEWVLTTTIKQCAEWRKSFKSLAVSINLSARNLHDESLAKQVSRLIRHWKIIPDQICLEITETAMMADPEHARFLLEELDRIGVRISIDDFGTGYSSLSYLKKLPVNEIKIDKSFVMNMNNSDNDASIIRATVGLAQDLGLSVVAEGVETRESKDKLEKMGCEIVQGFYISKPQPAEEISKLIDTINSSAKQSSTGNADENQTIEDFNQEHTFKHA